MLGDCCLIRRCWVWLPDQVLAVSSGFTVPAMGLMHCDSLQIFTRGVKGAEGERLRGGALGLGLLTGGAVFALGHSAGCKRAEILAIKDDGAPPLSLLLLLLLPLLEPAGSCPVACTAPHAAPGASLHGIDIHSQLLAMVTL
jgi:hypothetical protein